MTRKRNSKVVKRVKLSDFAGSWKMTDGEVEDFVKGLRRFWSRWKYPREYIIAKKYLIL
jgi:hypothetical protein